MPENKLQHYVPRAHLRPFTVNGAGKAVDLFHIRSGRIILGADAKGQCAKDYFYGKDLILEKALQEPEGHYARIVRSVMDGVKPPPADLQSLLVFFLLQSFRSYGQVERVMSMGKLMTADLNEAGLSTAAGFLEDWQGAVNFLLKTALEVGMDGHVEGLRMAIGRSRGDNQFVTSDDPAVHVNRYYSQRLNESSYGYGNTGLMFFLPLSPHHVFLAFDPNCYSFKSGSLVDMDPNSVDAINHLQMIFARNAIYLPRGINQSRFKEQFEKSKLSRPEVWSRISYLVEDSRRKGSFSAVNEMPESGSFMQHLEMIKPTPSSWPKALPFKSKIKSNRTGSGAGDLRPDYDAEKIKWNGLSRRNRLNEAI